MLYQLVGVASSVVAVALAFAPSILPSVRMSTPPTSGVLIAAGSCEGYLETDEVGITHVVCLNTGCITTCGSTVVYSEFFGDNGFACGCSGHVTKCCHLVWAPGGSGPEWAGEGECDADGCFESGNCESTPPTPGGGDPPPPIPPLVEAYCDG